WSGPAAAGKVSKGAMAYRNSPHDGHSCSGCVYFQPGANASAAGSCSVVAGSISPHGYCIAFTPKV
ncbi:high-potential iron-sulfur protein, partial [Acidihalobacter prosperus]